MLLPLQGGYTNCFVPRALPYAMCFWALAFPSAADLFDVQPVCYVIVYNHNINNINNIIFNSIIYKVRASLLREKKKKNVSFTFRVSLAET